MLEARLHAGDWLYIPAYWWHIAMCEADALSVSVGVQTRGRYRLAPANVPSP